MFSSQPCARPGLNPPTLVFLSPLMSPEHASAWTPKFPRLVLLSTSGRQKRVLSVNLEVTDARPPASFEVATVCFPVKREVTQSLSRGNPEIATACFRVNLEVARACSPVNLEVAGACCPVNLEVIGNCFPVNLEVARSCLSSTWKSPRLFSLSTL